MIWGCFTLGGVGLVEKINGSLTGKTYVNLLESKLKASMDKWMDVDDQKSMILQQDNAPCHTDPYSCYSQGMDERQQHNFDEFSTTKSDLNPIENLWACIKKKLYNDGLIRNKEDLWKKFKKVWNDIDK